MNSNDGGDNDDNEGNEGGKMVTVVVRVTMFFRIINVGTWIGFFGQVVEQGGSGFDLLCSDNCLFLPA